MDAATPKDELDPFNEALGGTWAVDFRTWRVRWSDQARRLHGVQRSHTPTIWQALDFIEPADRPELFACALRCAQDNSPFEVEVGLCTAQGERKRVRITGFSLEGADGARAMHGTISRIGDRPEQEDDAAAVRELLTSVQEWELVGRGLRHELKGPLAVINAFAHVLARSEPELSAQGAHRLGRIRAAVLHMESLLEGLERFAPLATHTICRERVDMSEIANVCVSMLADAEPERAIDVRIQKDLVAMGDPHMLRLVVQNLISNAWKFTRGRDDARIEFDVEAESAGDASPVFVVRDNGAGFDMKDAPRVFTPFERLHSHDEYGGTGLGLAIVRRAIERHGGSVWTRAESGAGAAFFFQV